MSFLPQNIRNQNRGSFMGSARAFATVCAGFATVFAAPLLWDQIEGLMWGWLINLYDRDLAAWLYLGLQIGLYPLIFFALRMTFVTAFVSAALFAATRLV